MVRMELSNGGRVGDRVRVGYQGQGQGLEHPYHIGVIWWYVLKKEGWVGV